MTTNSNFSYAQLSFGGAQEKPVFDVKAAVLIDNVTLTANNTGMAIAAVGVAPSSKNLSITQTKGRPLRVDAAATTRLPAGSTFVPNDIAQIAITGSTFATEGPSRTSAYRTTCKASTTPTMPASRSRPAWTS